MTQHSDVELNSVLTCIDASADQLVSEMVKAAQAHSTSRIQNFAPVLVNLSWARDLIQNRLDMQTEAQVKKSSDSSSQKGNQK